ncbi:hypothetical protein Lal_00048669 [Lupinus albus]|nr:hypothetical protein Lal_00048669 [Lupinus albus]
MSEVVDVQTMVLKISYQKKKEMAGELNIGSRETSRMVPNDEVPNAITDIMHWLEEDFSTTRGDVGCSSYDLSHLQLLTQYALLLPAKS